MNIIVFKMNINGVEDYAKISNFIEKREEHCEFRDSELTNITYKYYLNATEMDNRKWVDCICQDSAQFQRIKEPAKVKNINENFKVIYCIVLKNEGDIVELQNLYLLFKYFCKSRILILCEQRDDFYFKVSQYLCTINEKDTNFYNAFFFVQDGKRKRLQLKGLEFSRKFIPLQIIDADNVQRLFEKCERVLGSKAISNLFVSHKKEKLEQNSDILEGALKLFFEMTRKFHDIDKEKVCSVIGNMDVFSFILFCYTFTTKRKPLNQTIFDRYVVQMTQYANAIKQLAENVIFHSKAKCGCLSIRIHNTNIEYLEKTYSEELGKLDKNFLEILVSDFSAENENGDIAKCFLGNISDSSLKVRFKDLTPAAFFGEKESGKFKPAWELFYKRAENIGKHFGLRIFQNIVKAYNGIFIAESHCESTIKGEGEYFSPSGKIKTGEMCMPGTRYSIVLPLEMLQQNLINQDQSLDSGVNLSENIKQILNYSTNNLELSFGHKRYASQNEKNTLINEYAELFIKEIKKNKRDIVYISLDNIEAERGEILVKSIIIGLYELGDDTNVVFYNCTEELKRSMFETFKIFFLDTDIEGMFYEKSNQIIIYSKNYDEMVIAPSSIMNTNSINAHIERVKCVSCKEWYIESDKYFPDVKEGDRLYIPCDVLQKVEINGINATLFEHYAYSVLNENIQKNMFGCKLNHTHMRLGSTIHIDDFYEAEILFGNKLFVSRFALLLVKDMKEDIENIDKLTLYGYGTYSETVLVQVIEMIHNLFPEKEDVDYIILEREEERRGFLHKDRIRYNNYFKNDEERVRYFRDRKIAVIVLINSTLKTHVRLISLFKEENDIEWDDNNWILKNYAVILVGTEKNNDYWELNGDNVIMKGEKIIPLPKYFIQIDTNYEEPMGCSMCFPVNPMDEIPLIEVNAASTIPNQAFAIEKEEEKDKKINLDYQYILNEEIIISKLRDCLVYGHIQRNENHFTYYFKTENLWIKEKKNIKKSLVEWKKSFVESLDQYNYNIIVAPMHFSNAGFVELVNQCIFDGNAILLRIDFDKEYRSNAHAKFSYLRNYVKQLELSNKKANIRVHYVDDSIISGRTFHRAKSLVESVLGLYGDIKIKIHIFEKIFVLIDRNSPESRMQYIRNNNLKKDLDKYFYSYIDLNISSLRNYGDSCIMCNLCNESELLFETSSTFRISEHWRDYIEKTKLRTLEENLEIQKSMNWEERESKKLRAFRRLFCTHVAQKVLTEINHCSKSAKITLLILRLLNVDFNEREKDNFEYFLSYLKCISRPFLVFKKQIKESVFDILLFIIEAVVSKKGICTVIRNAKDKRVYSENKEILTEFNLLDKNILKGEGVTNENQKDLVKLIMKQLTELKSNYLIRPEKMNSIFQFMEGEGKEIKFQTYYMSLVKRLVGSSSDTTKSVWLDGMLISEMKADTNKLTDVPSFFKEWLIIENTRAYRDGVEKFYNKLRYSREFAEKSFDQVEKLVNYYEYHYVMKKFDEFLDQNTDEVDGCQEENSNDEIRFWAKQKVFNFLKGLPKLRDFNFVSTAISLSEQNEDNENWDDIVKRLKEMLKYEIKENEKCSMDIKKRLSTVVNNEINVFQYNNFKKVLEGYEYLDSNEQVTSNGVDFIVCCLQVLRMCRNKREPKDSLLQQIHTLAIMFKIILKADLVQFIIENKESVYLDQWKQDIEDYYNDQIICQYNSNEQEYTLEKISINKQKQYIVIAESSQIYGGMSIVDKNVEGLLERFGSKPEINKTGYIHDEKNGIVLWKLENQHRTVWVNMASSNWKGEGSYIRLHTAYAMRKVMMFYNEIRNEIFSPENDDFMNEISQTRKELNIYHSNKVYTHTKDFAEQMYYEQAIKYFIEDVKFSEAYPSYILNLLADINVSRYYRSALRSKFYTEKISFDDPVTWDCFKPLLSNGRTYFYSQNENENVRIILKVSEISGTEEVMCKNSGNSIVEYMLLLYSLILNAAEAKRGVREQADNQNLQENAQKSFQEESKSVIVEITKQNGRLIISNKIHEKNESKLRRAQEGLKNIPETEEEGISLWSFNQNLKRCISSYVLEKLQITNNRLVEQGVSADELLRLGEQVEKFLSDEYEVKVRCEVRDHDNYFVIELPVFMECFGWNEKGE